MRYIPQIRASDNGEPQRSHQTRVSVQVVEAPKESENPPVFKTNNQSVAVTESDEAGFLVALVQASDKDGDSLWYDILGKNVLRDDLTQNSKTSSPSSYHDRTIVRRLRYLDLYDLKSYTC